MPSENSPLHATASTTRAVRHHLAVVVFCLALGTLAGWLYAGSVAATYTSTARVLVNPSTGNPYVPSPSSVRQDEATSLETEAQVVRSAEVLDAVAAQGPDLTTGTLARRVRVTVPPNTQILEISYSDKDPAVARQVTDAVASAFLENRALRFTEVNAVRIERLEAQTVTVVTDLRAATAAAQLGDKAERLFQTELAGALRNELVSLRAQRTALDNSESPPGAVIAPASSPSRAGKLNSILMPAGGALLGLALGCLLALLLERIAGVVRSEAEVEATGLPVVAAVPPRRRLSFRYRRNRADAVGTTIRRLRASILDLQPRPEVIAVAPAGGGESNAGVSEAVAESFAKAGHRVVLVRTDGRATSGGLGVEERGLAQALLHERQNVLDLLQPSVDPLLCLLPDGGFTPQSRELLIADRLRAVLSPLIEAGHLVVLQSPGIDSAEGEAIVGAADLGLVVVTVGRTRRWEVDQVTRQTGTRGAVLTALVLSRRGLGRRGWRSADHIDSDAHREDAEPSDRLTQAPR